MEIAVFTSIRSEYGLLTPLIREINHVPEFNLKLLVGGAHLKKEFGETINQIKSDGFKIAEEFDFLPDGSIIGANTESLGKLYTQVGKYFSINKIDLLIVLGDRFELLPVATAALLSNIPIAHISGGETTEGAIDNQVRHALTKLSHLHFPATDIYARNIEKMGEEKWRICVSGEPGLDEILNIDFISKDSLFAELGLDTSRKTICCTFHPQTIDNKINATVVIEILSEIILNTDFQILTTASNFDNGGSEINLALDKFSKENIRVKFVKSLGQKRYYSLLKHSDLVLGNSSSGLVEAQSFNVPVINIGDRQKGRLANLNVLNTEIDTSKILDAVKYSQSEEFGNVYKGKENIYGDGKACSRIIDFIKKVDKDSLFAKRDNF